MNVKQYVGRDLVWHCDNERLFGRPGEPKVTVSISLGHSEAASSSDGELSL